jgi:hypothetical protein
MTEIEARVADLINFSSNQKPIEFEDAFKSVIHAKVAAAIEDKKAEIAQRMFTPPSDESESEEEFENEIEDTETEYEDDEDGEAA